MDLRCQIRLPAWLINTVKAIRNWVTDLASDSIAGEDIVMICVYTGVLAGMLLTLDMDDGN